MKQVTLKAAGVRRFCLMLIVCVALLNSSPSDASSIEIGHKLPILKIFQRGELLVSKSDVSFMPWNSEKRDGRIRVIQYLAARISAGEINQDFSNALEEANFPHESVLNMGIINADDSIMGTSLFIQNRLKSEKIKNPHASIIIYDSGIGKRSWSLKPAGNAIIITNRTGEVIFFKDGALTGAEIGHAIKLISNELN